MCYHLHIRPGPRVGELVYIHISRRESLQGQLRLSVIIQDGLLLDEAGKRGFQLCMEEMHTQQNKTTVILKNKKNVFISVQAK